MVPLSCESAALGDAGGHLADGRADVGGRTRVVYQITPAGRARLGAAAAIARAVIRASRVMRERPIEEIVGLLPPEARSEDPTVDIEALGKWRDGFSADGVIPPGAFEAVRQVVALTVDKVRAAKIDPRDVYTNEFVTERK